MPEGMIKEALGFKRASPIEEDMRVVSRQRLRSGSMHKT
jgi:hypothetical protein